MQRNRGRCNDFWGLGDVSRSFPRGKGQNSFLTAALFGAGTLWTDRRPILAGLCFGALCYKPHFGLLVPVALLAGCHWRALGAAFGTAAVLCAFLLTVFGWETWHGFFAAAVVSHATYESGRINLGALVTPFGGVLLASGTPRAAYIAQIAATLGAGSFVAIVWRRGLALPIRAALTAATLVAIPVALMYDLMLAGAAAAWLVRDPAGFGRPGKAGIGGPVRAGHNPPALAETSHFPSGPIVALSLLGLTAVRALPRRSIRRAATA